MDLANDRLLLLEQDLLVLRSFVQAFLRLNLHPEDKLLVFLFLILLSENGLFAGKLHFNFLLLNVLDAFNVVFLVHFTFPAVKFRGVFQAESHLRDLFIFLGF